MHLARSVVELQRPLSHGLCFCERLRRRVPLESGRAQGGCQPGVRVGIGRVDRDRPPEFGNAIGKTTGPEAVCVVQAADVHLVRVEMRRAALREPRAVGGVQGDAKRVGDANRNRILDGEQVFSRLVERLRPQRPAVRDL